jgi:hypothetical protein
METKVAHDGPRLRTQSRRGQGAMLTVIVPEYAPTDMFW